MQTSYYFNMTFFQVDITINGEPVSIQMKLGKLTISKIRNFSDTASWLHFTGILTDKTKVDKMMYFQK